MATAQAISTGQKLLLRDVDWQTYRRLLWVFAERRRVRLTYDRGTLEIMSPLHEHDYDSRILGRFVDTLTEEIGLSVHSGGSTTLRRRCKRRGLEPDQCFWIFTAVQMIGKRRLNLKTDPPPDLAIEVDVTSSSLNRMAIYAALRVPEVWRLDSPQALSFHVLGPKTYAEASHSRAFPFVTPADLLRFLALSADHDDNAVVRQFRQWVRQQSGGSVLPQP